MRVFLDSIGCRLNQSEIERLALQFRAAGHTIVGDAGLADLVVINTCSVTSEAASNSRQKVRQAARHTAGEIAVTGCWATLNPAGARVLPRVKWVVPNLEKDRLVSALLDLPEETFDVEPVARQPLPGVHLRTRAFLKVQDGCDNHCTFCVTRLARGAGRSLSIEEVLAEVRTAQAGGSQEAVLTGVHLGSWGQDFTPPSHLYQLVKAVLQETDLPRLRLSSLEPWDLDEDFFSLWQDPRMCRHLHLPLQSGCLATLKRMARNTTPDTFARLAEQARAVSPQAAITTDVIVGFPGESETEFAQSLEFVRQVGFAGGHVFHYSPRPGTAAEKLPGQVATEAKKERSAAMRAVLAEAEGAFYQRFIGSAQNVLWESTATYSSQGWEIHGLSDNYLRIKAIHPIRLWNQVSRVKILRLDEGELEGRLIG